VFTRPKVAAAILDLSGYTADASCIACVCRSPRLAVVTSCCGRRRYPQPFCATCSPSSPGVCWPPRSD